MRWGSGSASCPSAKDSRACCRGDVDGGHLRASRDRRGIWIGARPALASVESVTNEPSLYAIFDRDSTFHDYVLTFLKAAGLEAQTDERPSALAGWNRWKMGGWLSARDSGPRNPAERTGTCGASSVTTFPTFTRIGFTNSLGKDTPNRRPVENQPCRETTVISSPRLGVSIMATPGARRRSRRFES